MGKISVCIATYNGEKYISEQLSTILPQLSIEDEVIVSDDNSTDRTLEIISGFNDSRISVFLNSKEKGYTSNFENALQHTNGEYIFLSDQDDLWLNDKVSRCILALQDYDLVVSDAIIIDERKDIISDSFFSKRRHYFSFLGNLYKFGYLGCCFAFKNRVLKKALPFPRNRKYCTHDNWIFLIASLHFKTKILTEKLVLYRRHDANVSTGGFVNETSVFFKLKYRVYLIGFLIMSAFKT